MSIISKDLLDEVAAEADRAHEKYGEKSMLYRTDNDSLPVLMEEVGEVAREMNELKIGNEDLIEYRRNQRTELIQVAAMALTWAAKLDGTVDE
jgi:NTP pyrophosphatase (non-canonical NTP hydrolase)